MDDENDYYVILSRWNNESAGAMVHTFMIDKDSSFSYKYSAYNYDTWKTTDTTDKDDYLKFFNGEISNTFMCAYFVLK